MRDFLILVVLVVLICWLGAGCSSAEAGSEPDPPTYSEEMELAEQYARQLRTWRRERFETRETLSQWEGMLESGCAFRCEVGGSTVERGDLKLRLARRKTRVAELDRLIEVSD